MATIVITNASVVVNSVDLSNHVKQVKLNVSADMLEDTAMGASYHTSKAGLKKFQCEVEYYQDFASSNVDATNRALVGAAPFPLVVKGDASSGTNNTFTMANVVLDGDWNALQAQVGQLAMASAKYVPGSGFTFGVA